MKANEIQIGGSHYKDLKPEPWDVITSWGLGYLDGTALKYIACWKHKNGVEDIKKAIHFLNKLLEQEEKYAKPNTILSNRSVWDYADSLGFPTAPLGTAPVLLRPGNCFSGPNVLNPTDRRFGDEPF